MFTRAQACKSGLAGMEEPADGPFGTASLVRPPSKEAVGKPESSPAEPAGPVSVPAIPMVVTTSGGGHGNSGPVAFPFPGISLGCPGGQAGPMSIEGLPGPPSEPGTCPPPGFATENELYQTVSSDSDVAAPELTIERPEGPRLVPTPGNTRSISSSSSTNLRPRQPPPRAPTAAAIGLTQSELLAILTLLFCCFCTC